MKTLIIIVILLAMVVGFLTCLFTVKQKKEYVVVEFPDFSIFKKIADYDSLFPFVIIIHDTITGQVDSMLVDSSTAIGSIPPQTYQADTFFYYTVDGKVYQKDLLLRIKYVGRLLDWLIEADTSKHVIAIGQNVSNWSFDLYAFCLFNQKLQFEETGLEAFLFYKRFGLTGKVVFEPINNFETIQTKFRVGPVFKIL